MKKEAYEFKRDIVMGAVNPRTGHIVAERVLKYMEDILTDKVASHWSGVETVLMRARAQSTAVKNFELKSKMLLSQIRKFKQQLSEKEGLGEGLSRVDYDQLIIENKQFFEKIQERNEDLVKLKQTAGNAVLVCCGCIFSYRTCISSLVLFADAQHIQERAAAFGGRGGLASTGDQVP
jgi:hypothetical protein